MKRLVAFGLAPGLLAVWLAALPQRPAAPDVVLVTIDTLRADAAVGPTLAALAASGARFEQAVTTAPLTAPAHASMLTGLPVHRHGLFHNGGRLAAASVVPALRAAGWSTGAFVSAQVLERSTGLDAGFQVYDGARPARSGAITVARALTWYRNAPRPRFLWVHLYEPHAPYAPPESFSPAPAELAAAQQADQEARRSVALTEALRGLFDGSGDLEAARLLYAGEARWADALLGRVVEGAGASAVIIAAADHGEALGEHDSFGHGGTLFEEVMHVPLVVRWPGRVAAGTVERELASVAQIAGTLLEAAGLPGPPSLFGPPPASVAQYTSGQETAPRGKGGRGASLRRAGDKVVVHRGAPAVRYDLHADPSEAAPGPPAPELAAELERMIGAAPEDPAPALRALGYSAAP